MKHTISVLVENKFGVLARIAGLFSARGYNINSLAVNETHDPLVSHMTIVVDAPDERILEQIKKQLNRLIDVLSVADLTKKHFIGRELALIKINAPPKIKNKLKALLKKHKASIAQEKAGVVVIEVTAEVDEINCLLDSLKDFKMVQLVRTGRIAILK